MEILLGFLFLLAYLAFCYFLVVSSKSLTKWHTRVELSVREWARKRTTSRTERNCGCGNPPCYCK